MKARSNTFQRWMALFLCIVMFTTLLPMGSAFADDFSAESEQIVVPQEEPVVQQEVQVVEQPVVQQEVQVVEQPVVQQEVQVVEEPVVQQEVQAVEQPVVQQEVQVVEEPVVQQEVPTVVEQPVVQQEVQAMEQPVVQQEVQVVEEPVVQQEVQTVEQPVVQQEVQTVEQPAVQQEVLPVTVVFNVAPANASVSVYTKSAYGEKLPVNPQWDRSYSLMPGSYFYAVSADGYNAIGETVLNVVASVMPLYIPVSMTAVVPMAAESVGENNDISPAGDSAAVDNAVASVEEATPSAAAPVEQAAQPAAPEASQASESEVASEENEDTDSLKLNGGESKQEAKLADLATPVLKSVSKNGNGLQVTWEPVTGIYSPLKYRVYRKAGSATGWSYVADTAYNVTSYTDTGVANGTNYTYTVRIVSSDGNTMMSGYDATGKTATYWNYAAPTSISVAVVEGGVQVTWNSVGNCNYRVFHRADGTTTYSALGDTTSTSFVDTQVVSGNTYTYTVRVINSDGTGFQSDYSAAGKTITFYGKSSVKSLESVYIPPIPQKGVRVTWYAVQGVSYYRVERKIASANWSSSTTKDMGVHSGTSWIDESVASANAYTYRVYGVSSSTGGSRLGTYDTVGKNITYYDAPELQDIEKAESSVTIYWGPVNGINVYRVFRKVGSGSWTALGNVNTTTYTDKNVASGVTYTYTVRCMDDAGNNTLSSFDPTGLTTTFVNQPVMVRATAVDTPNPAIRVTWKQVQGIQYYQLYRKTSGTNWVIVKNGSLDYITGPTDPDAQVVFDDIYPSSYRGIKFTYTVRCLENDQITYASSYDPNGVTTAYFPAPVLEDVEPVPGGMSVVWGGVEGAEAYRVYRRISGGSWKNIADVKGETRYTDADKQLTSGVEYFYTVRVIDSDNKVTSDHDPVGMSDFFYGTPDLIEAKVVAKGVEFTFETVGDAVKYQIYRKTDNTSWAKLATTSVATGTGRVTYLDTNVISGTKYYYSAACMKGSAEISDHDPVGKSVTYYGYSDGPSMKSAVAKTAGVQVSWNVVDNITQYRVFRKEQNTTWKAVGDTKDTSFVDKTALNAGTYTYVVRCLAANGNSYLSDYSEKGVTITYYSTPQMISAISNGDTTTTGTVVVRWKDVDTISKYRVYRREGSGAWVGLATVTGTSYTDTPPKSGVVYTYTVRCMDSANRVVSDHEVPGKSLTFLKVPALVTPEVTNTGILVKWKAVDGATGYNVFRKLKGGSYKQVASVSGYQTLTWLDKDVISNQDYIYTVRATRDSAVSQYSQAGIGIRYLTPPILKSVSNTSTGVKFTWDAVSGAVKYRVFRKIGNGSWVGVGITTATSFTDTSVSDGVTYTYTVRCIDNSGNFASGFDSTGKTITYHYSLSAPVLQNPTVTPTSVTVKWNKVNGAAKYRVFRKTGSSGWQGIAITTALSYTDTAVTTGAKYTYTVRCVSSDGSTWTSSFDTAGKSVTIPNQFANPVLKGATNVVNGVQVSWNAVSGAAKYRVFRKTSSSGWQGIVTTTATSYIDTSVNAGTQYTYTVRCISSDGSKYTSDFDATGKTITFQYSLSVPVLNNPAVTTGKVTVSWQKVNGAVNYRVYRKITNGSWVGIGTTSGLSFVDNSVTAGVQYTYTVRCVTADAKSFTSSYNGSGKTITAK